MDQEYSPFSFRGTSTSRDAPNPLRPYYIPPSIGVTPDDGPANGGGINYNFPFSDLDYESYIPDRNGSTITDMTKRLVDQAIWNYTSVLLAQPFEVAKIVLQCHLADSSASSQSKNTLETRNSYADERGYFDSDEDSESDAPSYFTPTAPYETPSSPHRSRWRKPPSRSLSATPTPSTHSTSGAPSLHSLELRKNDSILETLSQLWSKEGAWGIWKGTNSTFIYNVLLKTIETWTRSLLSALLNLPDPSLVSLSANFSILDSANPLASIGVAVAAAGIAGLVLAPIDMIRTRLVLTSVTSPPRALLPSLRTLPSWTCPPTLLPITFLHSSLPTFLSKSTPFVLRSSLHIDPIHTPTSSSISTFLLSLTELFTKLPLETVLRRGHIAYLSSVQSHAATRARMTVLPMTEHPYIQKDLRTIVPVGPYRGIAGTIWFIVREEGQRVAVSTHVAASLGNKQELPRRQAPRKGQGISGLWRGWRVGFWGLVGMWCAGAVGGGGDGAF